MILNVTLVALLILALAGLAGLVWRKLPTLVITDPSQVKRVGQQQVKRQLVETRLKRKFSDLFDSWRSRLAEQVGTLPKVGERLKALEQRLRDQLDEHTAPTRSLEEFMGRAVTAQQAEDYTKAEVAYLEVLKIDPHHLPAYQGLGELYLDSRDYEHAREVYEYLVKRAPAQAVRLGLARAAMGQGHLEEAKAEYLTALAGSNAVQPRLELARIWRELGNLKEALEQLSAARQLEPLNPKILDFFIELSILNGQPNESREALDVLSQVNPDNQKIAEFAASIRELTAKLKPKGAGRKSAKYMA